MIRNNSFFSQQVREKYYRLSAVPTVENHLDFAEAILQTALRLNNRHLFKIALNHAEIALQQDETNARACYIIGITQEKTGVNERYWLYLIKAADLEPGNKIYEEAIQRSVNKDHSEARRQIRFLKKQLSLLPYSLDLINQLAKAYGMIGEDEISLHYRHYAATHNPRDFDSCFCLAGIYLHQKKSYRKALYWAHRTLASVKNDDQRSFAYFDLAEIHEALGNYDLAIEYHLKNSEFSEPVEEIGYLFRLISNLYGLKGDQQQQAYYSIKAQLAGDDGDDDDEDDDEPW